MRLGDLLESLSYEVIQGNIDIEINGIKNNSREVKPGDLFICIRGNDADGHSYAAAVACKGAAAIITERYITVPLDVTVIQVKNSRYTMGIVSGRFYDNPSAKLTIIGITGTKGKTTTAYMLYSILNAVGHKTGLIGTVEIDDGKKHICSEHTTPESIDIQRYFSDMVDNGVRTVVMEVSSQGLMLDRVSGVDFDIGIFTNLSKDHIGPKEHSSFEQYKECKKKLFGMCRLGIINRDSPYYDEIRNDSSCDIVTYGMSTEADYSAGDEELYIEDGLLGVSYNLSGRVAGRVSVDMPGEFTIYNSLAAIAAADILGVDFADIKSSVKHVTVKGRVEMIQISDAFTLMIDYAHNKVAMEQLLYALRRYNPTGITVVFGCGGNRSHDRRYEMGLIAAVMADDIILTNDNPRYENPLDIIDDIKKGVYAAKGKCEVICDRKEAIRHAILHAESGDIVVLAGKGHETYQDICGIKYDMDERQLIREVLEEEDVTKICGYNNRYFA